MTATEPSAKYELQRRSALALTEISPGNFTGTISPSEPWSAVPIAAAADSRDLLAKARELGAGEYRIVRIVQSFRVSTTPVVTSKVERLDAPAPRQRKVKT